MSDKHNDKRADGELLTAQTSGAGDGYDLAPGFTAWLDSGTRVLGAWIETNSAVLREGFGIAGQVATFSQSRVGAELDLWRRLSGCGSVHEVLDCQMRYAERATAEYLGEAKELAGRVQGVVTRAALALRGPAAQG